jgi:predicted ATP-binding protein involved in virulence
MRLNVQMLEDARGSRSVQAVLSLHGSNAWPEGPVSAWEKTPRENAVDVPSQQGPGVATRPLANLDLLAPDELDQERFAAGLAALGAVLPVSIGTWIERGGVAARFLVAGRATPEAEAVLSALVVAAHTRFRRRSLSAPLRVLRLELSDFRPFDHLTLAMSGGPSNVLVGVNGAGKTTVLDAVAILLSHLEAGIRGSSRRPRMLTDTDITNGVGATRIAITAAVAGNPVTWSLSHLQGGEPAPAEERTGLSSLDEEIARIQGAFARGDVCLPLVVHYSVNRAVLAIPLRARTHHAFEPIGAYDGALDGGSSNFHLFFEWFRNREDLENETRIHDSEHRDHQLQAVRRAIDALLPEISEPRVQRSPPRMLVKKGDWTFYVDQLSDGEKCLLAMAGDLARRLAMANPFADDPLRGSGVVLIDEIELHLHPGWQRRIVPALERAFPACQFIVSTHSAAVLGHVDHEAVFLLTPNATGVNVAHPDFSRGMDVNRILEDLLDVSARPEEFEEKLAEMHRLLDTGDTPGARALHAEIAATLGADDPALVRAEVLIRRREATPR